MTRYGSRPDAEAIANADKAKVTTPSQKEARHRHAMAVARKLKEAREAERGAAE